MTTSKLLIICQDRLGPAMAGPAIRSFEFATRLAGEWSVTLLTLQQPEAGWEPPNGVRLVVRDPLTWRGLRELAGAHDAVLTQPLRLQLQQALHSSGTPVVIDAYVPNILEQAAARGGGASREAALGIERARIELRGACRIGSAFLCAGAAYRDFLLGVLAAEGRITSAALQDDPTAEHLLAAAPFGVPSDSCPTRPAAGGPLRQELDLAPEDLVVLWAGGIWDWLDPLTPVRGLAAVRAAAPDSEAARAHLVFLGVDHPNPDVQTASLRQLTDLVDQLGLSEQVHIRRGWVPYAERGAWLADADIGVCAHRDSLETRFSWRQRLLDHAWAGLPTICGVGDELGALLIAQGAAIGVAAADEEGWAGALQTAADPAWRVAAAMGMEAVRQDLGWDAIAARVGAVLQRATSRGGSAATRSPASLLPAYTRIQAARLGPGQVARKAIRSLTQK